MHEADGPAELTEQERLGLEGVIGATFVQVEAAEVIRRDGAECDAIIDVSFEEFGGRAAGAPGSPAREQRTVRQTVAYFWRPNLRMPTFTAAPMNGIVGGAMRKALGFLGVPTVNISGHPDFKKRFSVMSFQPEWTRKLFTEAVIEAMSEHGQFTVKAGAGRVAVYRKGRTVPASERQSFLAAAREIADRIIESAAALPAEANSGGAQAIEMIQTMGGWFGRRLRARLVTTQEVNDCLAQAPPRVVPRGIRKWAYGASGFMLLWGAGLFLLGTIFVSCMLVLGVEGEDGRDVSWMPYVFMAFPLLGAVVLFFAARYRWRRRRVLLNGVCESAKVAKVQDTGFYFGSDRQHDVTFETASGRVVVRVGSGPASLARKLQERGETVRLLIDPRNHSRALWIEGWAMDAYE